MKNLISCGLLVLLFAMCGKKETHLISDNMYRKQVTKQFTEREDIYKNRKDALLEVLKQNLSNEQREALMFLYAYMPLNDLADYDGEYFLKQVNTALATRKAFEWAKTVPEDVFLHFVLPCRVNNENLDTARQVFFSELKERLKGMSMHDAVLEVNHWCHEKVTYQSTDIRTSAPLSTVRAAWGRCGEESTFTVAAMRAAGIPARQLYTPRWAHTDDNHAWVEVWVDGKWHYLGACEPDPELNMGWFGPPAKRAMLIHTNVFGAYKGDDEILVANPLYSKINLLSNYAKTKNLVIKVVDSNDSPVDKAQVEFKVFNYAEFYNIATNFTNNSGTVELTTGFGDLLVWAKKDSKYGYVKVDAQATDMVTIILNREKGEVYAEDLDMKAPPIPVTEENKVSAEKMRENNRRLKEEDAIRGTYEATFPKKEQSDKLADELGLDKDKTWKAISKSYGNWYDMSKYLTDNAENKYLFDLLDVVSDKDLRDTPAKILTNHLVNVFNHNNYPHDIFKQYVLSPRMHIEILSPWRSLLREALPTNARENVEAIVDWVQKNITINKIDNYYLCPITPVGVYNIRISDIEGRNMFFVALCRDSGIAARVNAATAMPQVYENGQWRDIVFEQKIENKVQTGTIVLNNLLSNTIMPKYYTHYTLASYVDGDFVTLNYENNPLVAEFPVTLKLNEGYYRLTTGNRADDGSVFAKTTYFNLEANETKKIDVDVRPIVESFSKLGTVSLQHTLKSVTDDAELNLQNLANKGLILIFIDPAREPSRHVMNDMPLQCDMFEKWGGNIVFVIPDDKLNKDFNPKQYNGLPKQSLFAVDTKREVMTSLFADMKAVSSGDFPVTCLITPQGDVVFLGQGYRIGIGEDLIKGIIANKLN